MNKLIIIFSTLLISLQLSAPASADPTYSYRILMHRAYTASDGTPSAVTIQGAIGLKTFLAFRYQVNQVSTLAGTPDLWNYLVTKTEVVSPPANAIIVDQGTNTDMETVFGVFRMWFSARCYDFYGPCITEVYYF